MKRILLAILLLPLQSPSHAQQNSWHIASGTEGLWILDVEPCPSNPDSVYALVDSAGPKLLVSADRGEHWQMQPRARRGTVTFGTIKPDAHDSRVVYTSYSQMTLVNWNNTVAEITTDGGLTWQNISRVGDPIASAMVERNPLTPQTVYLSIGWGQILVTRNGGQTWDSLGVLPSTAGPQNLAVASSDTNIMYATMGGYFYKSTDSGHRWGTSAGFPRVITGVAVHPQNSNIVYVTLLDYYGPPGGVYKSTDGGMSWSDVSNGLTDSTRDVSALAMNPRNANEAFAGTGYPALCYRTTDAGELWTRFDGGLPVFGHTRCITIDTINSRIYLGTNSGIYIRDLITSFPDQRAGGAKTFELMQNYPNPFNPITHIRYVIPKGSHVSIGLFDILGRNLKYLVNTFKEPGTYEAILDGSDLPSGIYLYRLTIANSSITRKALLIK